MTRKQRKQAAFARPEIFLSLALAMARQGKVLAVRELVDEALADHPGDPLYQQLAQFVLASSVPAYHAEMLADGPRNAAYRQAIEAAVPGKVVLDIGTGSGLLAMMAARAGAARVIACEMNAAVAETARRIIAANGLADRIEVHACHSSALDRASLFPEGAEVVISEIFSANVLGEGVLESLDHARLHLCAPDARFIPETAEIKVALAAFPRIAPSLGAVEGFDLGLFADHLPLMLGIARGDPGFALASSSETLARFDFTKDGGFAITAQSSAEVCVTGKLANGIAQWMTLDFGNGVIYDNGPGTDPTAHWSIVGYPFAQGPFAQGPFAQERRFEPGAAAFIKAFHHGDTMMIWAE